jgi:hypothetical protein
VEPTRNERFERIFREHYAAIRGYLSSPNNASPRQREPTIGIAM